jgi:hypothetical protein
VNADINTLSPGPTIMNTDVNPLVVLGLVIILVGIAALIITLRARRTAALRRRFGPEYARVVAQTGGRHAAEARLLVRQRRVETFPLKALAPADRNRYAANWTAIQAEFVDNPKRAVVHADELLTDVMRGRGYPLSEFEQRSADLSVHHPNAVEHYHAAHEISLRHARGDAGTEDLRQAMIHYRGLFDELIGATAPVPALVS